MAEPALIRASMGSSRRQLAGLRPDWDRARTARTPASHRAKPTEAPARQRGRSCRRSQAWVITPSAPSEPRNMRSGDGPAPDPGRRRDSTTPAGVTTRSDSVRSSMWVRCVAKCPPARVASQPPRLENSKDWGKNRRVCPWGRSCSSRCGPRTPACTRAARLVASISSTWSIDVRSRLTTPVYRSPTRGSTPPTTEEPPPKGMTAMFASWHQSSTSTTWPSDVGRTTRSGTWGSLPRSARTTSRKACP